MLNNFAPDKRNSSLWWRIDLDPKSPHYTSESQTCRLFGYSKQVNHDEPKSLNYLLGNKIVFLYKNYLSKSTEISIHLHRLKGIIEIDQNIRKSLEFPVVWLYPNKYPKVLSKHFIECFENTEKSERFEHWFSNVHEVFINGGDVMECLPKTNKPLTKDDYLDASKHNNLSTMEKLHNYLLRLHKMKYTASEIETFYKEFLNLKPYLK